MPGEVRGRLSSAVSPDRNDDRPKAWLWAALAVFPVVALLVFVVQGQAAWQLRLGDPDNYMRLAQIRDWLGGQSWWDVAQYRVDPPEGLRTHWSRLGDLPYAVPILLLRSLLSADLAERLVIVAVPPLLLLATLIGSARLAGRIAGWRASVCACLLIAASPQILAQFVPGRLDHHGLQMLLLVWALALAAGRDSRAAGLGAAALAAAALAVGLETAPYFAMIALWIGGRWVVRGGATRAKALGFAIGLAAFVPVVAILSLPFSEWTAPRYDALGRGHVAIALCGGGALAAAMRVIGRDTMAARLLPAGLAGAAALAALAAFPEVVRAPYSAIDSLLHRLWIGNLQETQSFFDYWAQSPASAVGRIAFHTLAAIGALALAAKAGGEKRDRYFLLALLALAAWPLALWQGRALAAATLVLVPPVAAILAGAWARWARGGSALPFAAAALLLNPASLPGLLGLAEGGGAARKAAHPERCGAPEHFSGLAGLRPGLVLGPIDGSAAILVRTPHSVVTASNHRNLDANGRAYRALTAPPAESLRALRALGVDYVVFCRSSREVHNLASSAPRGLLASLRAGRAPPGLLPLPAASRGEISVLAVAKYNNGIN